MRYEIKDGQIKSSIFIDADYDTKQDALTALIDIKCREAELLYNIIVNSQLTLDYSDASEAIIKDLKAKYQATLEFLVSNGIGGVLINGIFRDLSN